MIRTVDTRTIPAHNAEVELVMDTDRPDFFMVFVKDATGANIGTLGATTRAAALEAFRHPFAHPEVPDIFTVTRA